MCSCLASVVKYLLFFFNIIFAAGGIVLVVFGVIFKLDSDSYAHHVENVTNFVVAPIILIVVGCVVFVVAFFGCCGAIKENNCLLTMYGVILILLFAVQLAMGIYCILQFAIDSREEMIGRFEENLREFVDDYQLEPNAKEIMDMYQKNLECCGAKNYTEYIKNQYPKTCCASGTCNETNIYKIGCGEALYNFLDNSMNTISIVTFSVAGGELLTAVIAFCLTGSLKKRHGRRRSSTSG